MEYENIGGTTVKVFKLDDKWVFEKEDKIYDMAPAGATEFALSPVIVGVHRLITVGCNLKKISNPENGFFLIFSLEYLPMSDVKLHYKEPKFDGWIYQIEELNLHGFMPGQEVWICPYMIFYYDEPPQSIFLKLAHLE